MKKPHIPAIRELLRVSPDGLTPKMIHEALPSISKVTIVKSALRKMPDAYIDRWVLMPGTRGQHEGIWCVVIPPPHCPHPKDRFYKPQTTWKTDTGAQHES